MVLAGDVVFADEPQAGRMVSLGKKRLTCVALANCGCGLKINSGAESAEEPSSYTRISEDH